MVIVFRKRKREISVKTLVLWLCKNNCFRLIHSIGNSYNLNNSVSVRLCNMSITIFKWINCLQIYRSSAAFVWNVRLQQTVQMKEWKTCKVGSKNYYYLEKLDVSENLWNILRTCCKTPAASCRTWRGA